MNPFDAALAGLELAVLYLEEGRTAEVRTLAEELLAMALGTRGTS